MQCLSIAGLYNTILLYMFRASSAHLQEDRVVYMQHMVLSLCKQMSGRVLLKHFIYIYCNIVFNYLHILIFYNKKDPAYDIVYEFNVYTNTPSLNLR